MERIKMAAPVVEMDGDEMTRVMWRMIKEALILPYVELKSEYYDLGLRSRNATGDAVTTEAAEAAKKYGVAVKCSTITPNRQRMEEFPELREMWRSPNGTIRSILDGTVFRTPITLRCVKPAVRTWEKPITVARHAYGDIYKAVEMATREPGECTMTFRSGTGKERTLTVQKVDGPAIWQGVHNKEASIRSFARACFAFAADSRQDLWFSAKDTIEKIYDSEFKDIFGETCAEYRETFERLGISYSYTLIDAAAARVMRSRGGFIWALKNYDGDVMSDLIASAFGSPAMMSSVLVSPDGNYEFEAAHGTVTDHYRMYQSGEKVSTNPIATIFAWSGALSKRGERDGLPALADFGARLRSAAVGTMEDGIITSDLDGLTEPGFNARVVDTEEFLREAALRLEYGAGG